MTGLMQLFNGILVLLCAGAVFGVIAFIFNYSPAAGALALLGGGVVVWRWL